MLKFKYDEYINSTTPTKVYYNVGTKETPADNTKTIISAPGTSPEHYNGDD